jgi:hypothetical protein
MLVQTDFEEICQTKQPNLQHFQGIIAIIGCNTVFRIRKL